jgi:type I restriction enzyme S subunit
LKVPFQSDTAIQLQLTKVLSLLDQKIGLNNSVNAELEKAAKLLYDYWFVQFDFPDENGKPYRASGGAMEYNEQLKREIPKGWRFEQVIDILSAIESGSRPTGGAIADGIPSIGAENIESFGRYDFRKEKFISRDYYRNMKKGIVRSGDVLVYKDGAYSGKVSMALDGFPHEECAVNEHVFILRTSEAKMSPFFLYFALCRPEIYKKLNSIASSKAAQPGLNQQQLGDEYILVPTKNIMCQFTDTVAPIMRAMASNAKQSTQLVALRDFLLPLLMNGQVKVTLKQHGQ